LTPDQLKVKRFGLQAISPSKCQQLAPQLRAFKDYIIADVRLDRGPGLESTGNQK
jgi:hypothetical protein